MSTDIFAEARRVLRLNFMMLFSKFEEYVGEFGIWDNSWEVQHFNKGYLIEQKTYVFFIYLFYRVSRKENSDWKI